MKQPIVTAALAAAVGMAFSFGAQAAPVTLTNGSVTAVITDGGTFGVSPVTPLGTPGLSYLGTEFVNIDTPSSWWRMTSSAGDITAQFNSNPLGATTFGGPLVSTTLTGSLSFLQTVSLTGPNQISFLVQLHNTTGSAITGVKFGVGIDPDQGGSGNNTTLNTILGQGANSSVSAFYNTLGVTLANTTTSLPSAIAAFINSGDCCSAVNPATALGAGQSVGFATLADDSISLAYNIGTIGAHRTVTLGYSYTFTTAVPEPETYAMLLAGLGLVGFAARRRKQATA
jgi:hypothetical protein